MGRRPWIVVALAAVLAAMLVPGSAVSVVQHSDDGDSAEFDVRTGEAAPTAAQRAAAKRIGATVIWNKFGTPASLSKRGKFLATGIRGANAVAAARWWLNANKAILGLRSTSNLVLDADTRLSASNGHAVNFRQVFEGLEAAEGGLVTVGITGSAAKRWRVAYVSSSLSRATTLAPGEIELSPAEGLAHAAQAAGDGFSVAAVTPARDAAGYESFQVDGLESLQHVKLVSFPTPRGGVLPAYESLVVDREASKAHRIYVDARNGRVLARFNAVFNLADQELVPVTIPFSGDAAHDPEQLRAEARAVRRRLGRPLPARVRERRQPGPGHPPEALPGCGACRDLAQRRVHARGDSVRADRRRAAGQLLRRGLRLRDASRAADVHRHVHDRRHAGPASVPCAVAGVPGQPAARHARGRPVGQPEHGHARPVVLGRR